MNLFEYDSAANLLPRDGIVNYYGPIMSAEKAESYFATLLKTISWKNDEAIIFGKHFVIGRQVAWYGDSAYSYKYSGTTKQALTWTNELQQLKALVESLTASKFNSCLLNLYHNGSEGMGWHSDDEKSLATNSAIASVSLGAERKFCFKHKNIPDQTISLILETGSLLVMQGSTQAHWLHHLPKSKKILKPRMNLTFRTIIA